VPAALLSPGLERGAFLTLAVLGTVYAVTLVVLLLAFRVLDDDELATLGRIVRRAVPFWPRPEPSETR
jgi:hypothetical protein